MNEDQEIRAKALEIYYAFHGNNIIAHAIAKRDYEYSLFEGEGLDKILAYIAIGKKPEVK